MSVAFDRFKGVRLISARTDAAAKECGVTIWHLACRHVTAASEQQPSGDADDSGGAAH
jgi:hypothetical protein